MKGLAQENKGTMYHQCTIGRPSAAPAWLQKEDMPRPTAPSQHTAAWRRSGGLACFVDVAEQGGELRLGLDVGVERVVAGLGGAQLGIGCKGAVSSALRLCGAKLHKGDKAAGDAGLLDCLPAHSEGGKEGGSSQGQLSKQVCFGRPALPDACLNFARQSQWRQAACQILT